MLSRPPAPSLAPVPPEADLPRVVSDRIAQRIPEGIALGIPEGITVEVAGELAENLRHLARRRGQPLESLAVDLLRRGLDQERRRELAENSLAGLTPRQREVARLAVGGRTNRQIARELWLSPETVKTHLRRALEHFDLHSKAELRLLLLSLDGEDATKRDPRQGAKREARPSRD